MLLVPARWSRSMLAEESIVSAEPAHVNGSSANSESANAIGEPVTGDNEPEIPSGLDVADLDFSSIDILIALLSLTLLAVFVASLTWWIVLWVRGRRFFGEHALLPLQSRQRPFWNAFDFIVFYGVLLVISVPLSLTLHAVGLVELRPEDASTKQPFSVGSLVLSAAGMLLAMLGTVGLLRLRKSQVLSRLGFTRQPGGIVLGLKAAVLVLPPTMLLMAAVSVFQEYSHPVLDTLKSRNAGDSQQMAVFGALFFTTAIVAPLVEEFWFRGLLQGGLQRLADPAGPREQSVDTATPEVGEEEGAAAEPFSQEVAPAWGTGGPAEADGRRDYRSAYQPVLSSQQPGATHRLEVSEQLATVGQPVPRDSEQASRRGDTIWPSESVGAGEPSDWTPRAVWPMVVASLVFAVMHWGQGLAPIPLFLLSMGLGYLYRQTGSLVPSITVHFLLNAFTMTATFLEMLRGTGS